MGNCIETFEKSPKTEMNMEPHEEELKYEEEDEDKSGKMRIKIVLTKDELELLLSNLKNKGGEKGLEDVLKEIQRSREKAVVAAWKPSLDSITESPEVPQIMDK